MKSNYNFLTIFFSHYIVIQNSFIMICLLQIYVRGVPDYLAEHYQIFIQLIYRWNRKSKRIGCSLSIISRLKSLSRITFKENNIHDLIFLRHRLKKRKKHDGNETTNAAFRCLLPDKDYLPVVLNFRKESDRISVSDLSFGELTRKNIAVKSYVPLLIYLFLMQLFKIKSPIDFS